MNFKLRRNTTKSLTLESSGVLLKVRERYSKINIDPFIVCSKEKKEKNKKENYEEIFLDSLMGNIRRYVNLKLN